MALWELNPEVLGSLWLTVASATLEWRRNTSAEGLHDWRGRAVPLLNFSLAFAFQLRKSTENLSQGSRVVGDYPSPTRTLIDSDLTECLSGGFPVLIAGDLNAKHTDRNSRLITSRGSFLCDYTNRNSCLIYGLDSPTTAPYTYNATTTSLI
jgi:hypothetical protein